MFNQKNSCFQEVYLLLYDLGVKEMKKERKNFVDPKLITGISQGDETSFEKLYLLFSKKVYHTAKKMNLSHEEAEGIMQEVFLTIWENRSNLNPSLSINAYMISIVKSLVIKEVKKKARLFAFQKYNIPILSDFTNKTEDDLIYSDLHQVSSEMIHHLPSGQKKIFIMRNVEYLSVEEISERLNLSKRTVENQIFRATKSIKERLFQMKIISTASLFLLIFF